MLFDRFPHYRQLDSMDCGPACLRSIAAYHGRYYHLQELREKSHLDREGVSARGIVAAAEAIGLDSLALSLPFAATAAESTGLTNLPLPCIVHWQQRHFVVVYRISARYVYISDPAAGKSKLSHPEFLKHWYSVPGRGIAIALEPTPAFYAQDHSTPGPTSPFNNLWRALRVHRRLLWQLALGMLAATFIQLLFPFLTQAIVDIGIQQRNLSFVYLVLAAMLALFAGETTVRILQGWILLHVGTRVNVTLLGQFLAKLMRLPTAYFETKTTGDLLQRIYDQRRIEQFLTSSTLAAVFAGFSLLALSLVLWWYHTGIFILFVAAALAYTGWISLFLRRRAAVDHQRFQEQTAHQNTLLELLQGMPEIKLQRSERRHRRQWVGVQARLFRANVRFLSLSQYQDAGAQVISQLKDILITFVAARAVIDGQLSLGMMLAIQYIVGQLNVPLRQLLDFARLTQDARLSLERLAEVEQLEDETQQELQRTDYLPPAADLVVEGVSFAYNALGPKVLDHINLRIPHGQVTAIVGASGSGKTTLVKLLLGLYEPSAGQIKVGGRGLAQLSRQTWRSHCGAVLQDGYIFADTLERNIAADDEAPNRERVHQAAQLARLDTLVDALPLGLHTRVGAQGNGLSQGQRQRILIARAIYKNPDYLFFDEATNALDAENEGAILRNLQDFLDGRTAVVVAHRLSTVRHAHQIVVLEQGRVVETGNHEELVALQGRYFHLVREQLALGG